MNSKARRLAAKLVTSAHGTVIAYEHEGSGPALIVVDGALSTRSGKSALRSLLAAQLTVLECERRGRGDSGDTLPYVPWPIWYCTRGPRPTQADRLRHGLCSANGHDIDTVDVFRPMS